MKIFGGAFKESSKHFYLNEVFSIAEKVDFYRI